jgi:hypothetical protein
MPRHARGREGPLRESGNAHAPAEALASKSLALWLCEVSRLQVN